ncbi:MAG: PD-(D/E)XK nuclease family protein [Bacteroidia bacterium]|nr:PD-(D/E)XK nuclease family protein [Bacteroidia bacterium]MDW8133537.1 PD-(D/E)XK nuclease family protein [Bacteroidia bacterium]
MKKLLPADLWAEIEEAQKAGYEIVTADPYFAAALSAELPGSTCIDIFTWAGQKANIDKPNPIDLYKAFEAALRKIDNFQTPSLLNYWELAQLFARDWQEVLLGTSQLSEVERYWNDLAAHKHIQSLFGLYKEEVLPEVFKQLPFPLRPVRETKGLWEKLPQFIQEYQSSLQSRGKFFLESALHSQKVLQNRAIFLHIYSAYPLVEGFIKRVRERGGQILGWDISGLSTWLPEIWSDVVFPSGGAQIEVTSRRVSLHKRNSGLEVVEEAVSAIATYARTHPQEKIAIWCEGEVEHLLRHLLNQEGLGDELSPPILSLWEGTRVGKALQPYAALGLRGAMDQWPVVDISSEPQEEWAGELYEIVAHTLSPREISSWQFLMGLLQSHKQNLPAFSPRTRLYIGRLTQLAGGEYGALFIIHPPKEPLGSWDRPSFWIPSLRACFFPRERHAKLTWRLVSILLWGSHEIHLWRQAGAEYQTPIEELMEYADHMESRGAIGIVEKEEPFPISLSGPHTIETREPLPLTSLSPAEIAQFFVCPRRLYWARLLPERPASEPIIIGQILHKIIEKSFRSPRASHSFPYRASFRKITYRLSRRRLFYRIGVICKGKGKADSKHKRNEVGPCGVISSKEEAKEDSLRWDSKYRLLRSFMAQVGQAVLHGLVRILFEEVGDLLIPSKKLRWYHVKWLTTPFYFFPEFSTQAKVGNFTIKGRVDLLIQKRDSPSENGELSQFYLVDFKPSLPREGVKAERVLENLPEGWLEGNAPFSDSKTFHEAPFQLLTYMWLFSQTNMPVTKGGLIALWWHPTEHKENKGASPLLVYDADTVSVVMERIQKIWEKTSAYLFKAMYEGSERFPQTSQYRNCRHCDFALLCDRLEK